MGPPSAGLLVVGGSAIAHIGEAGHLLAVCFHQLGEHSEGAHPKLAKVVLVKGFVDH